ncbi:MULTISPECIES: helix-turn-helix transcriptional regulator [unclassified Pseudomonas]|uniref:helix-turn-helix domain-containing protein n=1 Tax=unclassified Pseudomonas TaxID=196821 RepID=UPI00244A5054|nr:MULTISPECIES: helix-turn-helix transcriptional regulator [unclassified Pseudomonas]MDG9924908.1 helix-turn-helix domain-containing protein [Pseudomonas sp. GD04045]MDH0036189.1 helix-turn-helix domain-containing protein [Pseudomonas sp. GD04019]
MSVQVITRDGEAEYAVLPWAEYQALLKAAGQASASVASAAPATTGSGLDQLASLREAKGMSQADLARAVGISPHYLNLFETGERAPDGAILRSLGRVLGVSDWEQSS